MDSLRFSLMLLLVTFGAYTEYQAKEFLNISKAAIVTTSTTTSLFCPDADQHKKSLTLTRLECPERDLPQNQVSGNFEVECLYSLTLTNEPTEI